MSTIENLNHALALLLFDFSGFVHTNFIKNHFNCIFAELTKERSGVCRRDARRALIPISRLEQDLQMPEAENRRDNKKATRRKTTAVGFPKVVSGQRTSPPVFSDDDDFVDLTSTKKRRVS